MAKRSSTEIAKAIAYRHIAETRRTSYDQHVLPADVRQAFDVLLQGREVSDRSRTVGVAP